MDVFLLSPTPASTQTQPPDSRDLTSHTFPEKVTDTDLNAVGVFGPLTCYMLTE